MKQKINTLLASLALLLCSITMSAQTFKVDGITYTVYNENEVYVSSGSQYEGDLIIPESVAYSGNDYKVTSIGENAFYDCSGLTSVTIPNSVTSIGSWAFGDCTGLTSVTIPNSVTGIGENAFYNCTNLEQVINFSNLHFTKGGWDYGYIARYATHVINAPNGSIEGDYVFAVIEDINTLCGYLGNDTELTLPANYKGQNYQIGSDAFKGYSSLTSVTIPNSVTSIREYAFYGCSGLTSITIGNSVTSIGENAFSSCSGLTSVTIPNSVMSIGNEAFYGCSGLTSVTIPNSVTSIGKYAFSSCSGLTSVHISDIAAWCNIDFGEYDYSNPLEHAHHLYLNGEEVKELVIPNSVTSIGNDAFSGCTGLTSVTIPNSVTSIGEDAFRGCSNLKYVINFSNLHFRKGGQDYGYIADNASRVINAPNGSIEGDYVFAVIEDINTLCGYLGNDTELTLPANYKGQNYQIGSDAFEGYSALTSVTIPNSVTSIGESAFQGCSGLTSITIGNSVTSIGDYAFLNCSGLTSVTIPNSVTSIGDQAFYDCSGLTSVTIGNSVTTIESSAFSGCHKLKTVVNFSQLYFEKGSWNHGGIASSATHVINAYNGFLDGDYVLGLIDGKNTLCGYIGDETDLTLPASYKGENYVIGSNVFSGCSALTSVTIPNSITSIGENAFYDCSGLTSVTIPNSVTSIGSDAFDGCSNLKHVINFSNLHFTKGGRDYGYIAYYATHVINAPNGSIEGDYVFGIIGGINALCGYLGNDTELTLPSNYKGQNYQIGSYAFEGYSILTSVTIPNSVTSIGESAFSGCSGLTSITIPNSVTSIGGAAFSGCSGLTSITIPNSVTSIGGAAFYGCSGLTSVHISDIAAWFNIDFNDAFSNPLYHAHHLYLNEEEVKELVIPNSVTSIGNDAFSGCTGLTSVTIPNSVTSIGESAFYDCSGLTSITIPNSVTSIGDGVFFNCSGLTSVIIPNSVTSIGNAAFRRCSGLTSVTIPNSVTSIGSDAFDGCSNLKHVINFSNLHFTKGGWDYGYIARYATHVINAPNGSIEGDYVFAVIEDINTLCGYLGNDTELTLPANYKGQNYQIGSGAFSDCSGLASVTIGNSVTCIGEYAFSGCSGLTSVTIPNSVTSIGHSAFSGCSGLTSVTIPNSVTSIGNNAFYNCTNLKYVVNLSNLPFKKGDNGYGCIALYADKLINVPDGTIEDNFVFGIIEDINTLCAYIGNDAELTLPANYKGQNYQIGSGAFQGCSGLTSVTIPNSVTSIGGSAFVYCSGLTSVTIGNSVTSIGGSAFSSCSGLTSITIPNSVTSIGRFAFSGCSGLTSITIPNSVTSIGEYAFDGCSSLPVENGIRYADSYLVGVTDKKLSTYIIQDGTRFIGSSAFSGCSALTSITIPNSVTSIGDDAFKDCQGLKTVVNFSNLNLVKGSTDYGYVAYYASKVINAPNASFEGNYVFSVIDGTNTLCLYLGDETELTLPANYKGQNYQIGSDAFNGYFSLTSVTIPNSVTSIGDYAFSGCSGLTSVTIGNSVTSIGNSAFSRCSGLTSVSIPNSIMSIGYEAFSGCSGLTSVHISDIAAWCNIEFDHWSSNPVYYSHSLYLNGGEVKELVIPNSVTRIGDFAFSCCSGLTSVAIPNSVTGIGASAFALCTGLTSVAIPNSVTSIQDYVFQGCSGLTSVTIPNSITSIGYGTFSGCSGLMSITIPSSVERIRDEAFYECSNLKRVVNFSNLRFIERSSDYGYIAYYATHVINAPNATIEGDYAFHTIEGKNILCAFLGDDTELTLPENYKEENYVIGASAFSDYTSLTSVTIPNSVTSIGDYAFSGCSGLTSVTIPNSVTSIGEKAFSGCKMIAKITIGNGITSISEYAFENCESLEEVYCLAENVPTTPTNAFSGSYIELATLYVPKVALKRYKVNAPWSGFGEIAEFTQTYTITYILDGVEFKKESWEVGTKIETPQAPEKEGHTFNGWENVPETMPANDIEIEGSYSVNKYLLTFKIEGEVISSEYIEYGAKIETPQAPEKEGHTFNGWENVPETMPAMDIVLYGSYTVNIYKVYYYVGEELVHTDEVAYGESIPAYEYIPTNGDKFMGWDGEKYDTMPAHDVTYKANIVSSILYINGDMSDYTIYDLNGRRIENINNLKNGVYIVNGKMTIVKVN